ncbi:MAG: hypothetical protein LAT84_01610 [Balneolia bacterium]|nr:hypothetical protein [Balneolia bacterium]
MEVLSTGKTSFKIEVPYKLLQTGSSISKPLIVYLHGSGGNINGFEKQMKPLLDIEAYHLFIQGPYADTSTVKPRSEWGFRWYLYNGKQGSFIRSLEYTSEFIQSVIDGLTSRLDVNRLCIIGYSMGAYQAGYFGLSRWKHTNDLFMINGRLKDEAFSKSRLAKCKHMNIVAIHGKTDQIVPVEGQEKAFKRLSDNKLNSRLELISGGHKLTSAAVKKVLDNLLQIGYKKN